MWAICKSVFKIPFQFIWKTERVSSICLPTSQMPTVTRAGPGPSWEPTALAGSPMLGSRVLFCLLHPRVVSSSRKLALGAYPVSCMPVGTWDVNFPFSVLDVVMNACLFFFSFLLLCQYRAILFRGFVHAQALVSVQGFGVGVL